MNFAKSKDWLSLAETCKKLGRARSTLMRLLPAWENVTSHKPRKDHSGKWFIPSASVKDLIDDPDLYLRLAGRATAWSEEFKNLKSENRNLKKENVKLKRKLKGLRFGG